MSVEIELSLANIPFQSILHKYCHNSRWIIYWDLKTDRFKCIENPKIILTPYNVATLLSLVLVQCCCIYLTIGTSVIDYSKEGLAYVFFIATIWLLNLLLVGTVYGVYQDRFSCVEFANNWVLEAQKQFFTKSKPCRRVTKLSEFTKILLEEIVKVAKTGKGDIIGILTAGAQVVYCIGEIIPTGLALFEMDIFGKTATYLYPVEKRTSIGSVISLICTTSLTTLVAIETMRSLRLVHFTILVIAQIAIYLMNKLDRLMVIDPREALKEYRRIYLMHNTCKWMCSIIVGVSGQIGGMLTVLTCTGTIVGFKLLSGYIYFISPVIALGGIFVAGVGIPLAERTVRQSLHMINEWKRNPQALGRQVMINKRILRTLKPIGFPIVGYGLVDKEFKLKYWQKIMDNTMDSCLMVVSITK